MLTLCNRLYIPFLAGIALLLVSAQASAATPSIIIEGGNERLRDNVRSFISLAGERCDTPLWRMRARLRELEQEIREAGRALGYYQLEYSRELSREDDCWELTITLSPGEPVRLNQVDVIVRGEGSEDPRFVSLTRQTTLRRGDQLDHGRYESLKGRFGNIASARGYFDGRFERSRVTVDREANTAHVELIYHTGPRYSFGEVTVEHDILDQGLIWRYLTFERGDPYDSDRLLELKNRLNASDYFRVVRIAPRLQRLAGEEVPVLIELEGRNRHAYSIGAGYATDTGARLLLGYENRYVNDRGHTFNAGLRLAELGTSLEAAYQIPMSRPAHEYVRVYAGYQSESTDDIRSDLTTVGTSYTRSEEGSDWLQTYAINYEREYFIVGDEPEQRTDLLVPALTLSRTRADGTSYPTSGWSLMGRVSGATDEIISDVSFMQFYGRGKYIQALGGGRLLLRLEGGLTQVGEFEQLPVSQRFFAGGDASVRGYDYYSLGPTATSPITGEQVVIGGNNLLVQSVEYDYRFLESWAAAVFFDQGNAFDGSDINFQRGVGVGIRWISPIGPVRVDVARALDGHQGWRLHLSMGPDL